MRCRTSRGLIPLGTYTETQNSQTFEDTQARGARFYLNIVDAGTGSGGLMVLLFGVDKMSGNAVQLSDGGAAVNAVGTWCYEISPYAAGQQFGNVVDVVQRSLPFQWFAQVFAGDNSPRTYSLSVEITD